MWTRDTQGRMAELGPKTKRYPSDLTDEEWAQIEPLLLWPAAGLVDTEIRFSNPIEVRDAATNAQPRVQA